jgi:hypothetical protein
MEFFSLVRLVICCLDFKRKAGPEGVVSVFLLESISHERVQRIKIE